MQHEVLLTSADVAKILGLTPASIRALERAGKLQAARTPSGVRIFRLEDVRRFKAKRQETERKK